MSETQISNLLNERKFQEIADLAKSNVISYNDYYITLRKNKNKKSIFSDNLYWATELPSIFLIDILNSPVKVSFYEKYFSDERFCNQSLNKLLIQNNFIEFKRFFKLKKCYRKNTFLQSIIEISKIPTFLELILFVQEMKTVLKAENLIFEEEEKENKVLSQIPFDKILIAVTWVYKTMIENKEIEGDFDLKTMLGMAIIRETERIINLFISLKQNATIKLVFNSHNEMIDELKKNPPFHNTDSDRIRIPDCDYRFINNIINKRIKRQSTKHAINSYLSGYADLVDPLLIQTIKNNKEYKRYRINDYKARFEEMYFIDKPDNSSLENIRSIKLSNDKVYNFYNIPTKTLTNNDIEFEILKANKLLQLLSDYKSPLVNNILSLPLTETENKIKSCFGDREHISLYIEEDLIEKISNYFRWNNLDTKNLLSLLTIDIRNSKGYNNLLQKPFIKFNDKIFWLGSLFLERRWDVILRNKLKQDKIFKKNSKGKVAVGLEDAVIRLFQLAGYKILSKEKSIVYLMNGEKAQIDLLAYRNGELIIAEVKSGLIKENPDEVNEIEILRLEGEAAEQLEKINRYIEEYWDSSIQKYFESNIPYSKLDIFSLCITDFFEGDLKLFKSKYQKISLIELDVILNNRRKHLLEFPLIYFALLNLQNAEYTNDYHIQEWDLWQGKSRVSLKILRDCIVYNRVWKDIIDMKKF